MIATFGGGCFWCLEPIYKELNGITLVESGYSGGKVENPSYEEVSMGNTDHAEVVQITFAPAIISYDELLYVFFKMHDPTTLNKQGNDFGTQYRSVIFYHDEHQHDTAKGYIQKITDEKWFPNPIVTELSKFKSFYKAEDYHQDFYNKNKEYPYCQIIIDPKIKKFREEIKNKFN